MREGSDPAELAAFGEWFAAGKLGDEWELSQLITALRDAGKIESEHLVLPRLAALSPAHPDACLTALEAWVLTNPTPYWFQRQEESIRVILRAGTDNGTPGAPKRSPPSSACADSEATTCENSGTARHPRRPGERPEQNRARPADR